MQKITSAYANKLIKSLEEDKEFWLKREDESSTYLVALDETPVIPEYDYDEVSANLAEIDKKIIAIKHALNVSNSNAVIEVDGERMTVDTVLIRMAQLNKRKAILDSMRKMLPKARERDFYHSRTNVPEYRCVNFDIDKAKADFEDISSKIMRMQMALDTYNQTVQFEVDM